MPHDHLKLVPFSWNPTATLSGRSGLYPHFIERKSAQLWEVKGHTPGAFARKEESRNIYLGVWYYCKINYPQTWQLIKKVNIYYLIQLMEVRNQAGWSDSGPLMSLLPAVGGTALSEGLTSVGVSTSKFTHVAFDGRLLFLGVWANL